MKFSYEVEAEHQAQADGHIRIAGEIIVDLQHEQHRTEPASQHSHLGEVAVHILHQQRTGNICHRNLLEQTDAKPGNAMADVVGIGGAVTDLPGHIGIADDGTGYQLEVHGHIHDKPQEGRLGLDIAAIDIHDIGDHLEGVEADADGQRELRDRQGKRQNRIDILDEEAAVLEDSKQRKADGHSENQCGLSPAGSGEPFHQQTAEPHHESRSEQQQNPDRLTPGIEQERHRHQYKIPYRIAAGGIVEDQVDRQEYIEEKQIGKYHIRNAPLTDLCRKSHGLSRGKYRFYFITNPREIKAFFPQLQRKIPFYRSLLLQ